MSYVRKDDIGDSERQHLASEHFKEYAGYIRLGFFFVFFFVS